MSTPRILTLTAAFVAFTSAAVAQSPVTNDEPAAMPGMKTGGAVQPVMDQEIFAHALFNQLEGRWNGSNTEFRWDGQGWVGTDYDKLWIKSEGTLQSNGTLVTWGALVAPPAAASNDTLVTLGRKMFEGTRKTGDVPGVVSTLSSPSTSNITSKSPVIRSIVMSVPLATFAIS